MGNVVAVCTAHIARHTSASFASQYGAAATPAQVASACGYPGSKASAWRQHLARQHGQGAVRTGHGRYPALTYSQWCTLLGLVQKASAASTAKQASAASARVGRVLWAKQASAAKQGAKQAKRQAKQAGTPAPAAPAGSVPASAPQATPPVPAQAS